MGKRSKKRMDYIERRIDALEAAAVKLDMRIAQLKERGGAVVYFVFAPRKTPGFRERVHYWICERRGEWASVSYREAKRLAGKGAWVE